MDDQMDEQHHSEIATAVSGSSEGGFIVDMHDGQHHLAHISHADDADAAAQEGKREFASTHRRNHSAEASASDDHSRLHEVSAMREEISGLRDSVKRLETNVADLLKHREGVKTAADHDRAEEVRELQGRVDEANDAIEHHMDESDGDHVERDAHGQDVRDPNRVHTAATETADAPPVEHHDQHRHAVETDAERNAHAAETLGVVNDENPAAASEEATYAGKGSKRPE